MKKTLTSVLCVISVLFLRAQSYHGLHGNLFSSGLTVYDNPASTVRLPHIWDITPIATQQKVSTNIIAIHDYSLLSSPEKSQYEVKAGYYSREAHYQSDFRLMNTRVALGKNKAIAFGANIRNYLHLRSTPYYFIDTIRDVQHFAEMNQMTTSSLGAKMIASSWGEIYGTYAQTIYCDEITHFSGGATLKIHRGLAGAYLKASNGNFRLSDVSFIPHFELYDGMAQVGYSSNFDKLYSDRSFNENAKAFLINTRSFVSLDLGVQFELKYEGLANEDDAPFYNWKIGLAILDIGKNQYQHSPNSLKFAGFHAGVEDEVLQRKFESITDIADLKDSLRTVANISTPGGIFGIRMPTRIVLNIDKHIHQHLYVHASLSANLNSVFNTEKFSTKELDMLTITPRWERERIGVFMPWQLNSQGQLWPGLAVKAGPFFFGLHKMSWIWNKKSMPNGGFYLGATFKKWNKRNKDEYSDCPRF